MPRRLSRHQNAALLPWLDDAKRDGALHPDAQVASFGANARTRHVLAVTETPEQPARLDCAHCAAEGVAPDVPTRPGWRLCPAERLPAPLTGLRIGAVF